MEPLLQVRNLRSEFVLGGRRVVVVEGLSLRLWRGKTLALVGESGCGKSVAALSLMRLLPKPPVLSVSGEVIYRGCNLLELSEREMRRIRGAHLAMIFQNPIGALNPVYTVGEQLVEAIELHLRCDGEEAMERAITALREVGIASPERRFWDYPHQLSGGMCQRVMIAMALVCEPEVLIADEPTTALDVTIQAQVLELMRGLQRERGMGLLLITHDMGVVAEMADEVVVMYAGVSVESGSVEVLFDSSSHPYTQGLFATRPTLEKRKGPLPLMSGNVPSLGNYPEGCRFHPRCPYVMPICRRGSVPEFSVAPAEHRASCWLLREGGEV